MGVSISESGGSNVDLQTILAGGTPFMERLAAFQQAAEDARAARAALIDDASRIIESARATQAKADAQFAANEAAAKQLRDAMRAAEDARIKFQTQYDRLIAAARS